MIRAEGVVGLVRGFFFAGAAATVVSLWGVHDGSTAALMEQMYKHLKDGRTTAQALRLAMLHLLDGHKKSIASSKAVVAQVPVEELAVKLQTGHTHLNISQFAL